MTLTIRRTNNTELRQRKAKALSELRGALGREDASVEDLEEWAHSGLFSSAERATYDDLRRILILLGEEHREY